MESKVYYGEYTLSHWISLILSRNIVLPDYQRSFVWDERSVKRLINSLQEHQFVQPITIARNLKDGQYHNILIDGQQRLTSIILAKLGYMPDKSKFKAVGELAIEEDVEDGEMALDEPIEWTVRELLSNTVMENSIVNIQSRIAGDYHYRKLTFDKRLGNDFFDKTFLGFSYIVPIGKDEGMIQNGFSMLFRNINYFGTKLSPLESRKSLYYMNSNLTNYFEGYDEEKKDVLCGLRIKVDMEYMKLDFVRYLAILSNYISGRKQKSEVLKGYSRMALRETYYADYVSYLMGLEQEARPTKFDDFDFKATFPNDCWQDRFKAMRGYVEKLHSQMDLKKEANKEAFTSWIDADMWLMGLMYQVVFCGKNLVEDPTQLVDEIKRKIKKMREVPDATKGTNQLRNIRERLEQSITIYGKYVQ